MTTYRVIDSGDELATVNTNPFSISLTDAGKESELLGEYESPEGMTEMEAEAPEDGGLALEEEWVDATDKTLEARLSRVAELNGWNIVAENDLSTQS